MKTNRAFEPHSANYENAVESYRQALREALKPQDAEHAIEALGELLALAKTIGSEEILGVR